MIGDTHWGYMRIHKGLMGDLLYNKIACNKFDLIT